MLGCSLWPKQATHLPDGIALGLLVGFQTSIARLLCKTSQSEFTIEIPKTSQELCVPQLRFCVISTRSPRSPTLEIRDTAPKREDLGHIGLKDGNDCGKLGGMAVEKREDKLWGKTIVRNPVCRFTIGLTLGGPARDVLPGSPTQTSG